MKLTWIAVSCLLTISAFASTDELLIQGKRIYSQIAGSPLSPRNPKYAELIQLAQEGKFENIVDLAMTEPGFLSSTVLNWSNFYVNKGTIAVNHFNDSMALALGIVRDNKDARLLGTGDLSYGASPRLGFGKPAINSNVSYTNFLDRGFSFQNLLSAYTPQWDVQFFDDPAGLMTTRNWAEKYYSAGTNRRAVVAAFDVFMCTPIEIWKTPNLSTHWIRRDIPRNPVGNARTFQTECRTCHATLDGLSPAFAHADFKNDQFIMDRIIQPKYLQHADVYPEGFVPTDNSWQNMLVTSASTQVFGWRGESQGKGIHALGEMFTNAEGFNRCLVKRSYDFLCNGSISLLDPLVLRLAQKFENENQFQIKRLLKDVVLESKCQEEIIKKELR